MFNFENRRSPAVAFGSQSRTLIPAATLRMKRSFAGVSSGVSVPQRALGEHRCDVSQLVRIAQDVDSRDLPLPYVKDRCFEIWPRSMLTKPGRPSITCSSSLNCQANAA